MPILLQMLSHMKEAKTAPILAAMDPTKAEAITTAMARRQNRRPLPPTRPRSRRPMTKRASAFLTAVVLAALTMSARAAEKVELRAGEHDGYGRIAIQWPTPITYQAKLDGQTLVIHFARPFTGQLNVISRKLGHYVANASQSADGMTITAKMMRPVELKTETVDHNIVAIDLVQKIEMLATKPDAQMLAKGKLIKKRRRRRLKWPRPRPPNPLRQQGETGTTRSARIFASSRAARGGATGRR